MIESKYPYAIITPNIKTDIIKNEPSRLNVSFGIRIGDINADNPKINKIFEIFEPITLPNAIPGVGGFVNIALKDADNSGNDVPHPINTIPITKGDKRNLFARATPLWTNNSPPVTNNNNHIQKVIQLILYLLYLHYFAHRRDFIIHSANCQSDLILPL